MDTSDSAFFIYSDPRFPEALCDSSKKMLQIHAVSPRAARYIANIPKWLLTQSIVLLYFESLLEKTAPPLTSANLLNLLNAYEVNAVSKNTAVSHLGEMRMYGLLCDDVMSQSKRSRSLVLSAAGEVLVRKWLEGHLQSLDRMDGGNRVECLAGKPELLYRSHSEAIRTLLKERAWSDPPQSVATFVWVESGGNILRDLLIRVPTILDLPERILVGSVRASNITSNYSISRSHGQRLIVSARELGLLGWERSGNGGALWISRELINAYRLWQAYKYAAIKNAWERAIH